MTRPLWIGRELVGIPDAARVVFPEDSTEVAIVAWPQWRVAILTPSGEITELPELEEQELFSAYFGPT